jgi:hypothetical protein
MPDLLSAKQIAERYKLSRGSLLAMESEGKLHPTRANDGKGQRRYDPREIERLQANTAPRQVAVGMYREFGTAGLRRWGGAVYEERLRELRGRAGRLLYREMRLNDPVIKGVFYAIEQSLKQANWRVKPASEEQPDKEAAVFLESCFEDMQYSFSQTLDFTFELLEQGFSLLEPVLKRRLGSRPPEYIENPAPSKFSDGRIGWRAWYPRPAMSLADGYEWVYDDNGHLLACRQMPEAGNGRIYEIPIEKLLHFRTTVRPSDTPEGEPIHRGMFLPYYMTKNLQEIEGIGIERDLAGVPVIYMGADCSLDENNPNSDFSLAKDLVTNLRNDEQAGVVIPHAKMGDGAEPGMGMRLELLSSSGARAHDVSAIILRYDKLKAMSVLAQFILLGIDRVGSFALSRTQNDLFALSVGAWLQNIADTINRHAIPDLFSYNVFPGMTGLPQLVPSDIGLQDLSGVTAFINMAVGNNLLHYDAELERHLRQMARLPEYTGDATQPPNNAKAVKDNSALLSRLASTLSILEGANVEGADEIAEMLGPLVEELQAAVGTNDLLTVVKPAEPIQGEEPVNVTSTKPTPARAIRGKVKSNSKVPV